MKSNLFAALIAAVLILNTNFSKSDALPAGSYQNSCTDCTFTKANSLLVCKSCSITGGPNAPHAYSDFNVTRCPKTLDIANCGGDLTCGGCY